MSLDERLLPPLPPVHHRLCAEFRGRLAVFFLQLDIQGAYALRPGRCADVANVVRGHLRVVLAIEPDDDVIRTVPVFIGVVELVKAVPYFILDVLLLFDVL